MRKVLAKAMALLFFGWANCSAQTPMEAPLSETLQCVEFEIEIPEKFSSVNSIKAKIGPNNEALHAIYVDPKTQDSIHVFTQVHGKRMVNAARRGAAKAYLNSTIKRYSIAGFALDESILSEIRETVDDFDFSDGMTKELLFTNTEGTTVWVRMRMMFLDDALCVTTTSTAQARIKELNLIADGISLKSKEQPREEFGSVNTDSVTGNELVAGSEPVDVYLAFVEASKRGDRRAVERLLSPIVSRASREYVSQISPKQAKGIAKYIETVSAVPGHVFGDLALVIKTDLNAERGYLGGLDTDPIFLLKIDDQWKLIMAEPNEIGDLLETKELKDSFKESFHWLKENIEEIRIRILDKNGNTSAKEISAAAGLVRKAIDRFHQGMCSNDESLRIAEFDKIMPTKHHFVRLFGEEDGAQLWTLYEPRRNEMRENTEKLKEQFESAGALVDVAVSDTRSADKSLGGRFASVLESIPEDIPMFEALVRSEKRTSGSSSYLVIDRKVVFMRGLDRMQRYLEKQKQGE